MNFSEVIHEVNDTEYGELILVWESSVKATHSFLRIEDFNFYRALMPQFLDSVKLHCIKNENHQVVGFIGTNEATLEMLFVTANEIGKGLGKQLLLYAIKNLNITKVDVNQDNLQAVAFYNHLGFRIKSISDLDGFGKPYPILHMELTDKQ